MDATQASAVTSPAEQALQMQNPSSEAIWSRAVEIFDGEEAARDWMNTPLRVLDNHTPQQYSDSGNADLRREVLTVLGRIDYGMYS